MLAPPWIPVPPRGYGGVESVVSVLTEALVARGHDVTLFAAPGSRTSARLRTLLAAPHPEAIERSIYEADHVARAFGAIEEAEADHSPFDILHDHCGAVALAMADRIDVPLLHTVHGPFTEDMYGFYAEHGEKAAIVAISRFQRARAPSALRGAAVIPNPIEAARWPLLRMKDPFLLWVGRMTEEKGPHRAIAAARAAGRPLVLAGPVQPGQEEFFARMVEPHLDGNRISYVGEIAGREKVQAFSRAAALLMPIRWPEPFGMVMVEAMACGTPVLAFREGSTSEVVEEGVSGFVVDDEAEMAAAVAGLGEIDPEACRASAERRFGSAAIAARYEAAYGRAVTGPALTLVSSA